MWRYWEKHREFDLWQTPGLWPINNASLEQTWSCSNLFRCAVQNWNPPLFRISSLLKYYQSLTFVSWFTVSNWIHFRLETFKKWTDLKRLETFRTLQIWYDKFLDYLNEKLKPHMDEWKMSFHDLAIHLDIENTVLGYQKGSKS